LAGGLPDSGVAANRRQRAVPGPDGNRKIESGNDPNQPQRMPLFEHSVLGPFGSDSQTIKLARKADSEVADIDHLLHFAFTFDNDLARFESYKPAKILLRIAQGVA